MTKQETYAIRTVVRISVLVAIALTAVIYAASLTLGRFQAVLLPDAGAAWYYWKLPKMNLWAIVSAWGLYLLHQLTVWWLLFKLKKQPVQHRGQVGRDNLRLLIINGVFILLHILQTMLFYDGLAQNVPVMSSQGSVIVMLVMILILLNGRRGLFFGKKAKLPSKGVGAVFKLHGLYVSWAIIYTFWFHPTEGTLGHLLGFFYIFLLLIQLSLANTSFHQDIRWVTLLEVYVAVHGMIVAIEAGNGMWPMFFMGFLMMLVVTQQFGLTRKTQVIAGVMTAYLAMALLIYSGVFGNAHKLSDIHQITWIPIILYGLVFVLAGIMHVGAVLFDTAVKKRT